MEAQPESTAALFDVYLRLRPSLGSEDDQFLDVEPADNDNWPKHITIRPPVNDHRKRAVEKFAFTRVFGEESTQLDIFHGTEISQLINGVLGCEGRPRNGLLATLGVTGSGKSHTILGSKSQRGLTQLALDVLFKSISHNMAHATYANSVFPSLAASDVSDAQMMPASQFLDLLYGDNQSTRGSCSRAQTPMLDTSYLGLGTTTKQKLPRASTFPQSPSIEGIDIQVDPAQEYAIVVSMYEVYNDRIFDLLVGTPATAKLGAMRRRPLLFKSTELSPDRKIVAGLRKIVCGTLDEALLVLESGLIERRVAGTGSNAVSSRSHGFFCVDVKRRNRVENGRWEGSTLTIVDLAGSERARNAKTAGATLAEAGKINESLMYLGQCMQMQNDNHDGHKNIVPFRQCKLTELLFSNSFPSAHQQQQHHAPQPAQRAMMIVTADARGDFNATTQILRYSALAREITVPRIPSVTSTILTGAGAGAPSRPQSRGRTCNCPQSSSSSGGAGEAEEELEELRAANARLADDVEILHVRLAGERERRAAAERAWRVVEERLAAVDEAAVRAEVFAEMDGALAAERARWRAAWEAEAGRGEERVDRKIEILARSSAAAAAAGEGVVQVLEDGRVRELEDENERLRAKVEALERERLCRTPSAVGKKQRVLRAKKWSAEEELSPGSP